MMRQKHIVLPPGSASVAAQRPAPPTAFSRLPKPGLDPLLQSEAEVTTEKFGLEAGLWKVWSDKGKDGQSKGQQVRCGRPRGGWLVQPSCRCPLPCN